LLFWDQYPANMYYSTSRRGSLNTSVIPTPDVAASYEPSASDWTCTKVRQAELYIVVDGIHTDSTYICTVSFTPTEL